MAVQRTILLLVFVLVLSGKSVAQNNSPVLAQPKLKVVNIPAPNFVHGFGISNYSKYSPEQSFKEAYEAALYDLASTLMTSVYLEFYENDDIPIRLKSEFAVKDSVDFSYVGSIDSAIVDKWAIYYVSHKNAGEPLPENIYSNLLSEDYSATVFNPRKIDGYYIAAGRAKLSRYNPERSFSLAKQDALSNLSLYVQTVVRDLSRLYNDNFSKVNYTTSQNIFNKVQTVARKQKGEDVFVLVAVKENEILTWNSHDN